MSEHFRDADFYESDTAKAKKIDNTPADDIKKQLLFTMAGLERVRAALDFPIKVTSGYRCPALNEAVGGSKNSQHMRGEAVDFVCPAFGSPKQICEFLNQYLGMLGIDQLIQEGTWVHVSFTLTPRREVLTKKPDGSYSAGV